MSKHDRARKIDQSQLPPATFSDYSPPEHVAHFIVTLARERLDLSEIEASYRGNLGQPPFDPALMSRV